MDVYQSYINRQSGMSSKSLFDFTPLTPYQQQHLTRVYAALSTGVLISICGVYTQLMILPLPHFLTFIGNVVCAFGVAATSATARREGKIWTSTRAAFCFGFAFLMGMSIADFLNYANDISPAIIPTAACGSFAIFTCMSLAAIFAKQRSYLYIGSLLSGALFYMFIISLANMFFRSIIIDDLLVYAGLFVMMG
eukprot:GHVT01009746.1.p1 GENE.GHVT01009746.1~~GHVT01009746.1.p1  ORF type:complete len:194 (+),score=7.04 GHVT01009746.1:209-790(+)